MTDPWTIVGWLLAGLLTLAALLALSAIVAVVLIRRRYVRQARRSAKFIKEARRGVHLGARRGGGRFGI